MTRSQTARLLAYLTDHTDVSSLDIIRDTGILNTTGRISDLRAAGHTIRVHRDADGTHRYRLLTPVMWPELAR